MRSVCSFLFWHGSLSYVHAWALGGCAQPLPTRDPPRSPPARTGPGSRWSVQNAIDPLAASSRNPASPKFCSLLASWTRWVVAYSVLERANGWCADGIHLGVVYAELGSWLYRYACMVVDLDRCDWRVRVIWCMYVSTYVLASQLAGACMTTCCRSTTMCSSVLPPACLVKATKQASSLHVVLRVASRFAAGRVRSQYTNVSWNLRMFTSSFT
jgi:hypothetical protein